MCNVTKNFVILLSLFSSLMLYADSTPEELSVKRIQAHLLIKDYQGACDEALENLRRFPGNQEVWKAAIAALASAGREQEMTATWKRYSKQFPSAINEDATIEKMAWGVITKGSVSPSPILRAMSLIGAFFAQDMKGVELLAQHLQDPNSLVRGVTVQFSSKLRDAILCDGMLHLLNSEKDVVVRHEVIRALGAMKIKEAKPLLLDIVAQETTTAEEKAVAIQALVQMLDALDTAELTQLTRSSRAGLRQLACQVVAHQGSKNDLSLLVPLLKDSCSDVRASALQTIGLLNVSSWKGESIVNIILPSLRDPNPAVAISAAWAVTLQGVPQGQKAFAEWLTHQTQEVRILAAAALGACGPYGIPLIETAFRENRDPYVRMNLAIALIGQRKAVDAACVVLHQGLNDTRARWMWDEEGIFRGLAPTTLRYVDSGVKDPETVSQLVHLEILGLLAMLQDPQAQQAIARYLQQKSWGVSGVAAALMLTEGDSSALDAVRGLLLHPFQKVRVQAALILALWGRDEQALAVLQEAYVGADRQLKEQILEGIGRVGARQMLPFLVARLEESAPTLRVIAASAILQTLYK